MNKFTKSILANGAVLRALDLTGGEYIKMTAKFTAGADIEHILIDKYPDKKLVYGMTHFLEHLLFRNPGKYTTGEATNIHKVNGGRNGGTTFNDMTVFFTTIVDKEKKHDGNYNIDTRKMEESLDVLMSIVNNDLNGINEDEFLKEKEIVIKEANQYMSVPAGAFMHKVRSGLLNRSLNDTIYGNVDELSGLTLDDMKMFRELYLQHVKIHFDVVYDSAVVELDYIKELLYSYDYPESNMVDVIQTHSKIISHNQYDYKDKNKTIYIPSNDLPDGKNKNMRIVIPTSATMAVHSLMAEYIKTYNLENNLTQILREQEGLMYGMRIFSDNYVSGHAFGIHTTLEEKNIEKFLSMFKEYALKCIDEYSEKYFNDGVNIKKTQIKLDSLNRGTNKVWFLMNDVNPDIMDGIENDLSENCFDAYVDYYTKSFTYEDVVRSLEELKANIEEGNMLIAISS